VDVDRDMKYDRRFIKAKVSGFRWQEKIISDNRTQMNADNQDFNKIVFCVNPRKSAS